MRKRILPLLALALAGGAAYGFARMDESKRRFVLHLLKQVPYLPGRHFA